MPRKKREEEAPATGPPAEANGTATADPPVTTDTAPTSDSAETAAPAESGQKTQPAFKIGPIATDKNNVVSAAVWENEVTLADGRRFKVHNVTMEPRYCDAKGEWKSAKGFRGSQLYAVIYCLQRASDFILASRDPCNDCPF